MIPSKIERALWRPRKLYTLFKARAAARTGRIDHQRIFAGVSDNLWFSLNTEGYRRYPELQAVLSDHLQFDESLGEGLSRVQVSAEKIYASAASRSTPANRTAALFGWAFCFTVGLFVLTALILTTSTSPQIVDQQRPAHVRGGRSLASGFDIVGKKRLVGTVGDI